LERSCEFSEDIVLDNQKRINLNVEGCVELLTSRPQKSDVLNMSAGLTIIRFNI
jgi:hypothetical protein